MVEGEFLRVYLRVENRGAFDCKIVVFYACRLRRLSCTVEMYEGNYFCDDVAPENCTVGLK